MTFTIFFVTTSYQSLKLVTLTYNEVTVTNLRIHYTVVIEKLVNVTKQCSDVHYIVFTVCILILLLCTLMCLLLFSHLMILAFVHVCLIFNYNNQVNTLLKQSCYNRFSNIMYSSIVSSYVRSLTFIYIVSA